jgi:hypothetical protein
MATGRLCIAHVDDYSDVALKLTGCHAVPVKELNPVPRALLYNLPRRRSPRPEGRWWIDVPNEAGGEDGSWRHHNRQHRVPQAPSRGGKCILAIRGFSAPQVASARNIWAAPQLRTTCSQPNRTRTRATALERDRSVQDFGHD